VTTAASQNTETVLIELAPNHPDPARRFAGTISAAAGKRLIINSPEQIAVSSTIRVQGKDLLFLGDVLESTRDTDGRWSVHMRVRNKFMIF
jgi:hypothetical protein